MWLPVTSDNFIRRSCNSTEVSFRSSVSAMHPLITQKWQSSGYTWTISSLLSKALHHAEEKFGPRIDDFFYAGHEFIEDGPRIWFPGNRNHVIIQLSMGSLEELGCALYELSHEVVHLLCPVVNGTATNLEEGLATWFSENFTVDGITAPHASSMPCYSAARDAISELLACDPYCIKKMREVEPYLSKISESQILENCPSFPEDKAGFLSEKFVRTQQKSRIAPLQISKE